jgi:hypothetical protein
MEKEQLQHHVVMKALSLFLLLLFSIDLFSQTITTDTEVLITKTIARSARINSDYDGVFKEGVTWIHLINSQDSLLIKTIYASSEEFDQTLQTGFIEHLNQQLRKSIPKEKDFLIRVIFIDPENSSLPLKRDNERIEERVKDANIHSPYFIRSVVIMTRRPYHW